ncbi:MAG: flagellar basal-body rod protein FlgF, partial [Deltaproteobacteria bacterium]|nr:flagellar basal-body rod protein FlgF [Deltaproteobacteria bacterium]
AQDGMLVTMDGLEVLGEGGSINIDGTAFTVDAKGNVSVDGNLVDTIKIVGFEQPDGLKKTGNSLFTIVDNNTVEIKAENTGVSQGFIELSNVNAISMITEMVEVLRGYESYQKAIKTADEANAKAINDIGRV